MTAAHRAGLHSTATMIYGHVETPEQQIAHLRRSPRIQDETGGFTEFIRDAYVRRMPRRRSRGRRARSGARQTRAVHAVARLLLHGRIDHVQAAWTKLGLAESPGAAARRRRRPRRPAARRNRESPRPEPRRTAPSRSRPRAHGRRDRAAVSASAQRTTDRRRASSWHPRAGPMRPPPRGCSCPSPSDAACSSPPGHDSALRRRAVARAGRRRSRASTSSGRCWHAPATCSRFVARPRRRPRHRLERGLADTGGDVTVVAIGGHSFEAVRAALTTPPSSGASCSSLPSRADANAGAARHRRVARSRAVVRRRASHTARPTRPNPEPHRGVHRRHRADRAPEATRPPVAAPASGTTVARTSIEGTTEVDTVIVGAGFAGLGAGIRLARRGEESFVILERANDVGGTWRDNVYPGVACDIPSHLYSFSFLPKPDWSALLRERPRDPRLPAASRARGRARAAPAARLRGARDALDRRGPPLASAHGRRRLRVPHPHRRRAGVCQTRACPTCPDSTPSRDR